MKKMTARERVYAAINRKEPDRVPICFGANSATVIEEVPPNGMAASSLYKAIGINDIKPADDDWKYSRGSRQQSN